MKVKNDTQDKRDWLERRVANYIYNQRIRLDMTISGICMRIGMARERYMKIEDYNSTEIPLLDYMIVFDYFDEMDQDELKAASFDVDAFNESYQTIYTVYSRAMTAFNDSIETDEEEEPLSAEINSAVAELSKLKAEVEGLLDKVKRSVPVS